MDPVSDPPPAQPVPSPALGRRSFLGWLTYALGAVAAAMVAIPFVGFLFGRAGPRSNGCPWGPSPIFRRARRAW